MHEVAEMETEEISVVRKPLTDSELRLLRGRVKHWLRETVILMVDNAGDVNVIEGSIKPTETQLKVWCAAEDIGKLIGKSGRNARSLRVLLNAISRCAGHGFTVDLVDGNEGKRAERMTRLAESLS